MSLAANIITHEGEKYQGDDRPIFVGQAPSRTGDPAKPLTGRAGERLARLSGLPPLEFYLATVRMNVFDEYQGKAGRGTWDAFPMEEARERALNVKPHLVGRRVVFVGRMVSEAFEFRAPWFEWANVRIFLPRSDYHRGFECAVIPHPSGRSRAWNECEIVVGAEKFLHELFSTQSRVPRLRALRERAAAIEERRGRVLKKVGKDGEGV